jgi:hypothetical protein
VALLALAIEQTEEQLLLQRLGSSQPAFPGLRTNPEVELVMRSLARRQPRWFQYGSIGSTYLGRPIPILTVTDRQSQADKRGVWVDAAIHGFEIACPEVVLGLAEDLERQIQTGSAPDWLSRVELYLVPVLNVDGRALCMRPPYAVLRYNLRPVDDDGDGVRDEESFQDLNGDGRIAALYRPSKPATYESGDADGDGHWGEDLPGGVDLNRNYPVASRERAEDWLPEPETQAVVEFWKAHPQIDLAISYHTSRNMFIEPNVALAASERARYARLADHFLKHFPGVYWQIHDHPDEYGGAQPLTGMNVEWFHAARGAIAFLLEIGPDVGPQDRGHRSEQIRLTGGPPSTTFRIESGYYRTVENRLESQIHSQRQRHAAYLQEVIARLDRGELE